MGGARKISDQQFLSILRENAGLYARTANAIKKQFGISYSRQAVRAKAEKFPEEIADIEEENLDIAEEGLMTLMRKGSESTRMRAIEVFLKNKGRKRGYNEKTEIDLNIKEIPELPNIVIK